MNILTPGNEQTILRDLSKSTRPTLICFSHLRWNFVFQRPQHLMTRFALNYDVIFWEEPELRKDLGASRLRAEQCPESGVTIIVPEVDSLTANADAELSLLLDGFLADRPGPLVRWYYTPMMLSFSDHVRAECVVYDCMDELSAFKGAPPELLDREQALLERADLVFTGGTSLYEAKRHRHSDVHAFPSSVDIAHFGRARSHDSRRGKSPRLGFYGVIDERMDLALVDAVAAARPEWTIEIVGPVVKIDPADLPQRANLHYPGPRSYDQLPATLASWDVALMPFAINEATRFISPTKTPEYLAAGCPVVSTSVVDVVRHYGHLAAVEIAENAETFVAACEALLERRRSGTAWRDAADALLARGSWATTTLEMDALISAARATRGQVEPIVSPTEWPAAPERYDVLVVGAGFAGAVMAERLANEAGKRVLVIDRRPHIAGNAFDRHDDAGLLIHQYGPHIFHTNSDDVFAYLSRFTEWRPYEHRVLADVDGLLVPIPINRTTLNLLYGLDLRTDADAAAYLASRAEPVEPVRTSADVVISAVGQELYETFFRGYTRKQWGLDPSQLDKAVTARVPTRTNTDDRYFNDRHQVMPLHGYTKMFERMLKHPRIDVMLGVDYTQVRDAYPHDHLVFTGPVDEYFGFRFGKLPYRSLRFEHRTLETPQHQPVAVVNYPSEDVSYTRVTEYKHLTGDVSDRTSLTYEYPSAEGDPYYPIPRDENQALYKRYEALTVAEPHVSFVGRLATYRYYNMDQVVGQALATFRRLASSWSKEEVSDREPVLARRVNA